MSTTATALWHNDGTSQDQRFPAALDPASFQIDSRSTADYLRLIALMASKLSFDASNTWRELLPMRPDGGDDQTRDWQALLDQAAQRRDNPPHLALLITFLRLFRHAQDHLNLLTKAHLDHYYRQTLGFRPRPAQPDCLVVFPQLAKGISEHRLPAGTRLDAGTDSEGTPLIYTTDSEVLLTSADTTAQAVGATFAMTSPPPVHLRKASRAALPAGSVKNLLVPDPAIASVLQPSPSFGGRAAESEQEFYTRVSERLRHRNRAVTPWDYERLVLENFPQIYKALCVRSGPGKVSIVAVPHSTQDSGAALFKPYASPQLREEIRQHLTARAAPTASISVVDPAYEELHVTCIVTFKTGKAPGIYLPMLLDELKRFLTPWAFDDSRDIAFGGCIHQSVIQAFIAGRDYVEHFTGFKLTQTPNAQSPDGGPVIEARATSPRSILVSAADHSISPSA